jgi:predicted MPP superfamily phosphohydrolase
MKRVIFEFYGFIECNKKTELYVSKLMKNQASVLKRRRTKKVFKYLWVAAVVIILIHVYSMLTTDQEIQYIEQTYISSSIHSSLDGYTIAFISDTHLISDEQLQGIVDNMNKRGIDALFLGGDYAEHPQRCLRTMYILADTQTSDGIYGIEGNHDDFLIAFGAMYKSGIVPLDNSGVKLRDHLYLGGVKDLWNRDPDIKQAISKADKDDFVMLLSHNPDVSMQQAAGSADLILSGHLHGGHVTFFGLAAPALWFRGGVTDYGQRFMTGWCKGADGTDVYVSNGVGGKRMRIFAPPQVIYITLSAE